MKSISLKDLKQNLSSYAEQAAAGETIEVTRYNKPFVFLTGSRHPALHAGARVGAALSRPVSKAPSQGRYLEVLLDDREDAGAQGVRRGK